MICDIVLLLGRVDVNLLVVCINGLLLVVGLGKIEWEVLSLVLDDLSMVGVFMLGIVGNGDWGDFYY